VRCRSGASLRPPGKEWQPALEPIEQLLGRKDARPSSGELDRERQTVEPAADLLYRLARFCLDGTLPEKRHRVVVGKRRYLVLPLARESESSSARRQERQVRARLDELSERGGAIDDLLQVVEQK